MMGFKDKEWQLNRTMGQMERLAEKACHYAGMGINPQCSSCNGLDTDCAGYITDSEFNEDTESA